MSLGTPAGATSLHCASLLAVFLLLANAEVVLPGDPRLRYIGRFEAKDSVRYFAWPGTQIMARFNGSSLAANLSGSETGDRFLTVIDGRPYGDPFDTVKRAAIVWKMYALASGLEAGEHTVVLWKITEDLKRQGSEGASAFAGFWADSFSLAPPPRSRRLEFIGDSDTAGFCADGFPVLGPTAEQKSQNTYESWASQLARALGADFVAEAISGYGVEEYTGSVPDLLGNTCPFQSDAAPWNALAYIPDAVIMLIGPNDEMKLATPRENLDVQSGGRIRDERFRVAYLRMMERLVNTYAKAPTLPKLIHVCGGSINGLDPCDDIQTVSEQFNTGRVDGFRNYYTSITRKTWQMINAHLGTSPFNGCDGHYNKKGHAVVAQEILPQVQRIMGWDEDSVLI